jgi:CheY-like chemotaxis protein
MAANDVPALLVVDDDTQIRDIVTRALAQAGYSVRSAANGREALTVLQSYVPDLILLDLGMPEMSGVEVLQRIHNDTEWCHIPVIVMSGSIWLPRTMRAIAR